MRKECDMKNRGSIIIEAALIFPVMILVTVAMIYILVHMYQQTCLQSVINMVSERYGYYLGGNIIAEDLVPENRLYYYLHNSADLKKDVEPYLNNYYQKFTLSENQMVEMSHLQHPLFSQIEVIIHNTYKIPFFSETDKEIRKSTKAKYYIHDGAEYVRNVDLLINESYSDIDDIFKKAVQRSEKIGRD